MTPLTNGKPKLMAMEARMAGIFLAQLAECQALTIASVSDGASSELGSRFGWGGGGGGEDERRRVRAGPDVDGTG